MSQIIDARAQLASLELQKKAFSALTFKKLQALVRITLGHSR